MRHQRNRAQVAGVRRAVHVRGDGAFCARSAVVREGLPPNVEEHTERVRTAGRRFDLRGFNVDDAAGVVRVDPVQATLRILRTGETEADALRYLDLLAVDEEREMRMDVQVRVLHAAALDAVDRTAHPALRSVGDLRFEVRRSDRRAVDERDWFSGRTRAGARRCIRGDAQLILMPVHRAEDQDHQQNGYADADVDERHGVAARRRSGATPQIAAAVGTSRL